MTRRLLAVPLVSKMCPSDVYRVWKRGESLRVDTSLLGFEHMTWQRGRRSFIFRGQGELWGTCGRDKGVGTLRFSCDFYLCPFWEWRQKLRVEGDQGAEDGPT